MGGPIRPNVVAGNHIHNFVVKTVQTVAMTVLVVFWGLCYVVDGERLELRCVTGKANSFHTGPLRTDRLEGSIHTGMFGGRYGTVPVSQFANADFTHDPNPRTSLPYSFQLWNFDYATE